MKILTVVGARPQFIKAAAVSDEIRKDNTEILVHTGQHYDENMSKVFFDELGIPKPDYNLGVGSGSHAQQTAQMMLGMEKVLLETQPDMVLLYGDTNSTLAGAITAAKLNIPIAHVEAGVRFHLMDMPEEQNRVVADHLSSLLFASTLLGQQNLLDEKVAGEVHNVGDVMYDALIRFGRIADGLDFEHFYKRLTPISHNLDKLDKNSGWYYCTSHRPENTDDKSKLENIFAALNELDAPVLFPAHPRIQSFVSSVYEKYPNIVFVQPVSYIDSVYFTKHAKKIVTDSGGLHKEAYLLGIPCVTVLRSGWEETKTGNWNVFVSPDKRAILDAVRNVTPDVSVARDQFGDGCSAKKIVGIVDGFAR